ncbi:hypothetical protein WJX73_001354 [Symbiochloris irregularis]|uniref:NOT2/NOT3/NOT5 C-terminal domain-containing protein n=1 Tax=Symbiochloris irregularis TaxID=706552 RepID=A0AAW1PBN6_9CHLO
MLISWLSILSGQQGCGSISEEQPSNGGGNAFQLGGGNPSLQHALSQGNYNLPQGMQGILQGSRAGVNGLQQPGNGQQNAAQSRFGNAQLPGNMSQFPHGLGRSGAVGFPAMNGLSGVNANAPSRGNIGGPGTAINAALGGGASLRPGGGMDRGGLPPASALGLGGLGPGSMQQRQGQPGAPQNLGGLGGPSRGMTMGGGPMGGPLPGGFNSALGMQAGSPRVHGGGPLHGQQQNAGQAASKDLLAMIGKGSGAGGGSAGGSHFAGFGSAVTMSQAQGQQHGHGSQQSQKSGVGGQDASEIPFHPSDFPALGGSSAAPGGQHRGGDSTARGANAPHLQSLPNGVGGPGSGQAQGQGQSNALGADLYASMHIHKGQGQEPFSMQQEEFPALPGSVAPGSRGGAGASASDHPATSQAAQTSTAQHQQRMGAQQHPSQQQSNNGQPQPQALPSPFMKASALSPGFASGPGQQQQQGHEDGQRRSFAELPSGGLMSARESSRGTLAGAGPSQQEALMHHLQQQQQHSQRFQQGPPKAQLQAVGSHEAAGQASAAAASTSGDSAGDYGLLGLLTVISMSDADVTTLALGTDLTTLGLHLNGVEPVYDTFASPWAEYPIKPDPDFKVPPYYRHKPPRLHLGYLSKFTQETLFYVFYSMPGDEAQILAADELSHRGWWFHKEHKVWLKRAMPNEPGHKPAPDRSTASAYWIFDPTTWETVRKENIQVLLSDLERPPNLPRNPTPPPQAPNQGGLPLQGPGGGVMGNIQLP